MPSLSLYKKTHSLTTNGEVRKSQSDMIEEYTWGEDIASRVGYLYDWYHDDNPTQLIGLNPQTDTKKTPIDIKFKLNQTQTFSADQVTFHIELRPSQTVNVDYYNEYFTNRYGAQFPVGLYIDIPDEKGIYRRWLVVGKANFYATQFPTYEILPCGYIFRYILDGVKYKIASVLRSQNSYNSGLWSDYKISSVEDQQKMLLPLNRDTEKLYYNQRAIIDNNVLTEPRAWKISKINRLSSNGIIDATFAQDLYNEKTDYLDSDGNWWADYWATAIEPVDKESLKPTTTQYAEISYTGNKPEVKIGGNAKKFTVKIFDSTGELPYVAGTWSISSSYTYNERTINEFVQIIDSSTNPSLEQNQIQLKILKQSNVNMWVGKAATLKFETTDATISKTIELDISTT